MRTHTYWITYEEYLACGGVPRKPPLIREVARGGLWGAYPYRNLTVGLRRTPPYQDVFLRNAEVRDGP